MYITSSYTVDIFENEIFCGKIVKILKQLCPRHTGAARSVSSSGESSVSTGASQKYFA